MYLRFARDRIFGNGMISARIGRERERRAGRSGGPVLYFTDERTKISYHVDFVTGSGALSCGLEPKSPFRRGGLRVLMPV